MARYRATSFAWQEPDEWRLDRQLADYAARLGVPARMDSSEHFLTARSEVGDHFSGRRQWLMESFYRSMRKRHDVLMDASGKPLGGQWNYDAENRKPWTGNPPEPADKRPRHNHAALWQIITTKGVDSFGSPHEDDFRWPLNRSEASAMLDIFIRQTLPHFGEYQDAMSGRATHLFHSMLSFALNVKMLTPREVIDGTVAAYRSGHVPLAAAEGFIRQILGWREYVRGIYWAKMPGYAEANYFNHERPLPDWFWTGSTKMRCLAHALEQSLDRAHAHHIQRLMVIGNFALLAGLDPQALHRWYLGVYIDAFEWVELPNTLGMSQFADAGMLATKPYVSSAAYIDRMSDYCRGCQYDRKSRTSDSACPFNALYWNFFDRNQRQLEGNPRLGHTFRHLAKMDEECRREVKDRADYILGNLETV
ncbi:cryptochrome/photolyase family protein [Novosphingobium sp. MW5]|nr:cryptochrome/photolyase family protein [Novosphingobium sp. MW5]